MSVVNNPKQRAVEKRSEKESASSMDLWLKDSNNSETVALTKGCADCDQLTCAAISIVSGLPGFSQLNSTRYK